MSNINTVALSGNLTADPELRHTPSGTAVASLRMAVNRRRKDDQAEGGYTDEVSYFDLTAWGNFGELLCKKLSKGSPVSVQGRLEQQRWTTENDENRSKVVVIVNELDSQDLFKKAEEGAAAAASTSGPSQGTNDDDIPF